MYGVYEETPGNTRKIVCGPYLSLTLCLAFFQARTQVLLNSGWRLVDRVYHTPEDRTKVSAIYRLEGSPDRAVTVRELRWSECDPEFKSRLESILKIALGPPPEPPIYIDWSKHGDLGPTHAPAATAATVEPEKET